MDDVFLTPNLTPRLQLLILFLTATKQLVSFFLSFNLFCFVYSSFFLLVTGKYKWNVLSENKTMFWFKLCSLSLTWCIVPMFSFLSFFFFYIFQHTFVWLEKKSSERRREESSLWKWSEVWLWDCVISPLKKVHLIRVEQVNLNLHNQVKYREFESTVDSWCHSQDTVLWTINNSFSLFLVHIFWSILNQ